MQRYIFRNFFLLDFARSLDLNSLGTSLSTPDKVRATEHIETEAEVFGSLEKRMQNRTFAARVTPTRFQIKSFRFHIVVFSDQSTFDYVSKCQHFDELPPHERPCKRKVKRNNMVAFSNEDTSV